MDGSEGVVSANLTSELAASSQNSLPGAAVSASSVLLRTLCKAVVVEARKFPEPGHLWSV